MAGNTISSSRSGDNNNEDNGLWSIGECSLDLLDDPIDFIIAEHHRHREVARILLMIASGELNDRGINAVIEFLGGDFVQHTKDEEVILFPALRKYCLKEDKIDTILARLEQEHLDDGDDAANTIAVLKSFLASRSLNPDGKRCLVSFAEHIQQHLALENGVLLPIARARLEPHILDALAVVLREHYQQ